MLRCSTLLRLQRFFCAAHGMVIHPWSYFFAPAAQSAAKQLYSLIFVTVCEIHLDCNLQVMPG